MKNSYNRKLDRLITHNGVHSSYGGEFHQFVMDEIELGARVALAIDDPEQAWWEIVGNRLYEQADTLLVAAQDYAETQEAHLHAW